MYHQLTRSDIARQRKRLVLAVILVCALAAGVVLAFDAMRASTREQGAASMRNAIIESAEQCCAVEGSYPSSLEHLENEYGLRVNTRDYVITYESFASNVIPSVVVVPR